MGWLRDAVGSKLVGVYKNGSHRSFGGSRDAVFMTVNELLDTLAEGEGDGMYLYVRHALRSVVAVLSCLPLEVI